MFYEHCCSHFSEEEDVDVIQIAHKYLLPNVVRQCEIRIHEWLKCELTPKYSDTYPMNIIGIARSDTTPYNLLRIVKLTDTLGLTELHRVAFETLMRYPRNCYKLTTSDGLCNYQKKAGKVYNSLPYKAKNNILLRQVELSEQKQETLQNRILQLEQELDDRVKKLQHRIRQLEQELHDRVKKLKDIKTQQKAWENNTTAKIKSDLGYYKWRTCTLILCVFIILCSYLIR